MSLFFVSTSEYSSAPGLAGARRAIASFLLGGLLTVMYAGPAPAGMESSPSSVEKGVLLVASPSLNDPNFREAVVLIVDHGPEGTLGLILNRSTNILLSEALPDLTVLKGTSYRLFAGGPVQQPDFFCCSDSRSPSRRTIGLRRDLCGRHTRPGAHHYTG